jgi:hypothetical protein
MKVYTNIKVLKKAWNLLKELELDGLLSSGKIDIDFMKMTNQLLTQDKLNEFCQIITKSEVDFEEMELVEVVEVISDFFTGIGSAFQKLNLPVNAQVLPKK